MAPLLKVRGISLNKGKSILKNISLEVGRGEILTVLGPSGAGKTSLLRCLNRLETIDGGEIFLDGKDTRTIEIPELRRRMGMVFQTPALSPGSVKENIRIGPKLRKVELSCEECLSLLGKVGLGSNFLNRQVETLSVGEQQRVSLAQVLANRPSVLLMDEPTSALDPTAVLTIENLIKTIHRDLKTATLLVTHNVDQALRFDAQTLVMVGGEALARGNIRDLMNSTDNETLKKFFQGRMDRNPSESPQGEPHGK